LTLPSPVKELNFLKPFLFFAHLVEGETFLMPINISLDSVKVTFNGGLNSRSFVLQLGLCR